MNPADLFPEIPDEDPDYREDDAVDPEQVAEDRVDALAPHDPDEPHPLAVRSRY